MDSAEDENEQVSKDLDDRDVDGVPLVFPQEVND